MTGAIVPSAAGVNTSTTPLCQASAPEREGPFAVGQSLWLELGDVLLKASIAKTPFRHDFSCPPSFNNFVQFVFRNTSTTQRCGNKAFTTYRTYGPHRSSQEDAEGLTAQTSSENMRPSKPLPFSPHFAHVDEYIESLLFFVTSSETFQHLCGGVHILEFLTQEPDLYASLLPEEWRSFFDALDVANILDLLMKVDLDLVETPDLPSSRGHELPRWCSLCVPPPSLLEYIRQIRQHSLDRDVYASPRVSSAASAPILARTVAVGMKPKKIHEAARLARYVDQLITELSSSQHCQISHLVDFGSGQNYLGRALVSPPYEKRVIALESKPLNIDGARSMDVTAKLAKKEVILRDKKQYRSQVNGNKQLLGISQTPLHGASSSLQPPQEHTTTQPEQEAQNPDTNIRYIETIIQDGDLSTVLSRLPENSTPPLQNLMVISLHSCGNLLHHGLRSLTLNPSVRAVALVGCCYNLLTERLGPATYKHPQLLRSNHPRLQSTSSAYDPHGFPMSRRLADFHLPDTSNQDGSENEAKGVRLNITARMMAVQAPQNWGHDDT
ncbi:MAG: hypothetical protein Q9207_008381, partial [Kuettlingeria erythrocarpa]